MEITNEFRSAAFSAYLGARSKAKGFGGIDQSFEVNRIEPDHIGLNGYWVEVENCKIQLHRLSEMSEEDFEGMAGIVHGWDTNADRLSIEDAEEWLQEVLNGNRATYAEYVSGEQFCELLDYLRSKSYALPFRGVDLIKAGIAEYIPIKN